MAFNHREMFEALQTASGVKVKYKNESTLMKTIGVLSFYNRDFMTNMITTIGETIYFPDRNYVEQDLQGSWETLCHELVHVYDYRRNRFFGLLYLFPQILAVLALLAIPLQSWWPLLALLFLGPIPAPWRKNSEMRGYAMTMATWYWYRGSGIPQALKADIAKYFTGSLYYFMWPLAGNIEATINVWSKRILTEEIFDQGDVYQMVHDMIKLRQFKAPSR